MSEESVKTGMVRAKTEDGRKVVGWYVEISGQPFLFTDDLVSQDLLTELRYLLEKIDISTAAVATGKLDKHGVEIYGSMGEMQGGDRVKVHSKDLLENCVFQVEYDCRMAAYKLQEEAGVMSRLSCWRSDELEIIKPEEGK